MEPRTLCIYVDESGNFGDVRDSSRYCTVTLVFQDETAKNAALEREYGDAIFRLGADPESMVFHWFAAYLRAQHPPQNQGEGNLIPIGIAGAAGRLAAGGGWNALRAAAGMVTASAGYDIMHNVGGRG